MLVSRRIFTEIFVDDSDTIDKRIRGFFGQCRRGELAGNQADMQYEAIKKDYLKTLEDSEEKVQLANQIYELVDRYVKRLDNELHKFKCELEADNQGITEVLEKRSLDLDGSSTITNQKENRYFSSIGQNPSRASASADRFRHKVEKRRDSGTTLAHTLEKRQTISSTPTIRPSTPNLTQVLQSSPSVGGYSGSNPMLVQAAAQAIERTQQMQQGRRTASLKASYEAISGAGINTHELLMGRDLSSGSSHHGLQSLDRDVSFASGSQQKRYKKKMSLGASSSPQSSSSLLHTIQTHSNDSDELLQPNYINDKGMMVEQTPEGEWTYDPNEPRYCVCNQVSYGEMVACDNSEVNAERKHEMYPTISNVLFLISVPTRMVPLSMRWHHNIAQG